MPSKMKANTRMDCCICFISCWQWSMFLPIRWKIYIGNQHGALPKSYQERVLEGRKKFKCKLCNWKDDQQISLKFDNEQVTIINTPRYWPLNCQISRYLGSCIVYKMRPHFSTKRCQSSQLYRWSKDLPQVPWWAGSDHKCQLADISDIGL